MNSPRRQRIGVMLAYPLCENRLSKWPKQFFVQPKLDGIRALWVPEQGLLSSTGKEIVSVPHIERALVDSGLRHQLDGELYIHGKSFQEIASIVRREKNLHPDYEQVVFTVFDIKVEGITQDKRIDLLMSLGSKYSKAIQLLETHLCDKKRMMEYLTYFIEIGFEGIILRHPTAMYYPKRSTDLMKLKPTKTDNYLIIGVVEEVSIDGILKNSLGAFICQTGSEEPFQIGSGPALTRDGRRWLWLNKEKLIGKVLEVKYQELTNRKVPRFPVALRILSSSSPNF